jgi:hypothetical protein
MRCNACEWRLHAAIIVSPYNDMAYFPGSIASSAGKVPAGPYGSPPGSGTPEQKTLTIADADTQGNAILTPAENIKGLWDEFRAVESWLLSTRIGVVTTSLVVPSGATWKVYGTNVFLSELWVGGGDIVTFFSADGLNNLGTMEVDSAGEDGGGQFLMIRNNTNYGVYVAVGDTIPAGTLMFYGIGLQQTQTSAGISLIAQQLTTPDNFYPSVKGITTSDGSVKVADATVDLDFRVSTPAFAGFIPVPVTQAYTVDLAAATAYKVVKIYLKTSSGTCTAALNRNGSAITGASAISVSSVRTSVVLSQVVVVDDLIELVLSNFATPLNLAYSVRTQPN